MERHIVSILLLIGSLVSGSTAQQGACSATDVAVGVMDSKGESFRGLSPADFVAHASKGEIAIRSLHFDDGPRRVALVVDQYKKLPSNAHQASQELVKTLLAAARPQDSFALVVARGPAHVIKFGEDRAAIADTVKENGQQKGKGQGVLDAVMEAISLFGEQRPGDAIVVIAADLGGNRHAKPKTVAEALAEHGIRMFGLALGPVSRGNVTASAQGMTAWGLATVTPGIGTIHYSTGDENFLPLATDSGAAVLPVINTDEQRTYNMSDPKLQQRVRQSARMVSSMISSLYRMQLQRSNATRSEDWQLDVTERIHKTAPRILVLYPHQLGPC
jgi:hypothetical protein